MDTSLSTAEAYDEKQLIKGRELHGKSALVTGASRGIGRAIAEQLVAAGARTWILGRSGDQLTELASLLSDMAVPLRCDLADARQLSAAVEVVKSATGGAPDIIVNNAGVFAIAALDETDVAEFERSIQLNLVAPFAVVRAFLGEMKRRGHGHIVTIGSVADRSILPGNGAYSAAKFGARAMHEVLRAESRGTGVRATLVAPAATDTPLWDPIDPDNREGFPRRAEMLRAESVADAVMFAVTRPVAVNIDELRLSHS